MKTCLNVIRFMYLCINIYMDWNPIFEPDVGSCDMTAITDEKTAIE